MRFRFLLPLLIAPLLMAGAKKPVVTVRFHLKAAGSDAPPFVVPVQVPGAPAPVNIKKIPEISERSIQAIYPFQAADGTMGCAYKLDAHGRIGLDTTSSENKGGVLVAFVNGRLVTAMLIDKRISDGVIMIPSGLFPPEIDAMKKLYPVIGETPKKGKKKR